MEEIRDGYGFDVTCQGSVPIAIKAYLERSVCPPENALRLAISMGDGGWRREGRCKGYITIEASHSIAHMILVECCSLFTGGPYKAEQSRLNLHRRYFEILAEAEGMVLTSWGEGVAA